MSNNKEDLIKCVVCNGKGKYRLNGIFVDCRSCNCTGKVLPIKATPSPNKAIGESVSEKAEAYTGIKEVLADSVFLEHLKHRFANDDYDITDVILRAYNHGFCKAEKESHNEMVKVITEYLVKAAKYGYEYHANTSFPDMSFEDNCLNNFLQAMSNYDLLTSIGGKE